MNQIFYTGVTGMAAYQNKLNDREQPGKHQYTGRPEQARFENLLYSPMDINNEEEVLSETASGNRFRLDMRQAPWSIPAIPDFAIAVTDFAVDKEGVTEYTRMVHFVSICREITHESHK